MAAKERSRAYPGSTLEQSVNYARKIREALGKGAYDREALANALGYSSASGDVARKIAAMVQFGLLDKSGNQYKLSLLSESITHPKDDKEFKDALVKAIYLPPLFKEVLTKFEPDGLIPKQLPNILYRDHGITNAASSEASQIFLQSCVYAGILNENNQFVQITNEQEGSCLPLDNLKDNSDVPTPDNIPPQKSIGFEINRTDTQMFKFALTKGKFAELIVPTELKNKDIAIIRKQIELLELQVDEEAE